MRLMAYLVGAHGRRIDDRLFAAEHPAESDDKTMNTVLSEMFVDELHLPAWLGDGFVLVTIISEGCLLFVAAQAGFIDGPRVLANMARDSWMPHWFGNLSERLSVHNGVMLMGFAALAALWFTGGDVDDAVGHVFDQRVRDVLAVDDRHVPALVANCGDESPLWQRRFALFLFGATMCVGILDRQRSSRRPTKEAG